MISKNLIQTLHLKNKIMKKIKLIFSIILTLLFFLSNAQNTYIRVDSTFTYGIDIIEGSNLSNGKVCKYYKGKVIIEYMPDEISEYCTENNRAYISKKVTIDRMKQKRFLEVLTKGKLTLYFLKSEYGKHYFIENEKNEITELLKKNKKGNKNYKEVLTEICNNCEHMLNAANKVKFKKKHLINFINHYNACSSKPEKENSYEVRKISFGISCGITFTKLISSKNADELLIPKINSVFDKSFSFGVNADIPISNSNLYFRPELNYVENAYFLHLTNTSKTNDILLNFKTLYIPVTFKYQIPINKLSMNVDMGAVYSRTLDFKQEVFRYLISDHSVIIDKLGIDNIMSDNYIGYTFSIGSHYQVHEKFSLILNLRYSNLYPVKNNYLINKSIINLFAGINF